VTELVAREAPAATIPGPRFPAPGTGIPPLVVAGEVVRPYTGRAPIPRPPWEITDPAERAAIAARVAHYRVWWRRLILSRPPEPTHLHRWTPAEMAAGRRDNTPIPPLSGRVAA
jgi:hypothetical protein